MQRITITIEDDLLAEIDAAAKVRGYQNRSEIIRDLARAGLQQSARTQRRQANASRPWSMSTTMLRATCQSGWCRIFTATTICRWQRCTSISTTTVAWR